MRPAFNFEPKYRVTILTREEWSRRPGTPPVVKGIVWYTGGSRMMEGTGAEVCGKSVGRRLSISLGSYGTVFQAELYVILACAYEIELYDRPEKYVSIVSDSQAALKALQSARTTSPLVQQCQKGLKGISTRHIVGMCWVLGHAGLRGNEIVNKLARDGSVQKFVGHEPSFRVCKLNIRRKIKCWINNKHLSRCRGLGNTQR